MGERGSAGRSRRRGLYPPGGEYPNAFRLRNFRLPDPPTEHRGETLTDKRFSVLAGLVTTYLWVEVIQAAEEAFGTDAG